MAARSGHRDTGRRTLERRGRAPLTPSQIVELDIALVEAFQAIGALRRKHDAARHIKFPPLPSIFSESIVIVAAKRLFGESWVATYGGRESDVRLEDESGRRKLVEVKATGVHAFQEFKSKDLRADFLVWIRFGRRFQDGGGPIEVVLVREPGRLISSPCRLDTTRFERLVGSTDRLKVLKFQSLGDLLCDDESSSHGSNASDPPPA